MHIATSLARKSHYIVISSSNNNTTNKKKKKKKKKKKLYLCFFILILTFLGGVVIQTQVGQSNLLLKKFQALSQQKDQNQQQSHSHSHSQNQEQQKTEKSLYDIAQLRRDWHDYEAIDKDALRPAGLGEFGKPAHLPQLTNENRHISKSLKTWGFNAPLSEQISLERALPDVRHESCRKWTYNSRLPKTSIIIVSHNEERSVLLRTLYSLLNRTPAELLEEIILIDDFSEKQILGNKFDELIRITFREKVKIFHAESRIGLIRARVFGARRAKGEVLVFLDAHVEATHNWLPPLLDPIQENPKTCTTPIIDTIDFENFGYVAATASRGGFNWQFNYVQLPLLPAERKELPAPHNNPIMNGGLFAIAKDFFWQLGAYDEDLEIWGAEQFELSFKIWMCGGRLLEVPCARLGHLYRSPQYRVQYTNQTDDFISRNYKRIAEVWMDSYKEFLYEHIPKLNGIEAGNLTERRELRRRLKCKSFKWFLETIAPDLMLTYPPIEPNDYAKGALQSLAAPELCLDSLNRGPREMIYALRPCSPDLRHPYTSQRWHLSFRRDLRDSNGACLEVQSWERNAPMWLWPCHNQGGNQLWYYERNSQLLVHGSHQNDIDGEDRRCLEANILERKVYVNECDFFKPSMKWRFGYINQTAFDNFFPVSRLKYTSF